MFLIAGGTGLGTLGAVIGGAFRLSDSRHRLRLDRLGPADHWRRGRPRERRREKPGRPAFHP
jgi:hypothetical protein